MNIYQTVFLMFVFLPPVLSIVIDKLTLNGHIKKFSWIKWSESILPFYLLELGAFVLVLIYIILGEGL